MGGSHARLVTSRVRVILVMCSVSGRLLAMPCGDLGGRVCFQLKVVAGPKRGRPCPGFPDLVRPYVRPYVRTSVSIWFNFVLHGQYTSDPQYFYRFRTPYKMTIRGAD